VAAGSSAKTLAQQVNAQSANTGVTATARTSVDVTVGATGQASFTLQGSNTTAAQFTVNVTNTADLSTFADAINAKSAQTGISAIANGGTVTLTSETGDDVVMANNTGSVALTMGAYDYDGATGTFAPTTPGAALAAGATLTSVGRVSFKSSQAYTATTDTAGTLFTAASNASALNSVATINVGSQLGANDAISVIDGALDYVNGVRAKLGAVQNRVDSTVSNLSATSENLSAARSRIQDADFASETANLTRAQVLQQAGMAMLAQANALPQNVLSLLR